MNFGIPDNVAPEVAARLAQLRSDYNDGLITDKGYVKKYHDILNNNGNATTDSNINRLSSMLAASSPHHYDPRASTHTRTISTASSFRYASDGSPSASLANNSKNITTTSSNSINTNTNTSHSNNNNTNNNVFPGHTPSPASQYWRSSQQFAPEQHYVGATGPSVYSTPPSAPPSAYSGPNGLLPPQLVSPANLSKEPNVYEPNIYDYNNYQSYDINNGSSTMNADAVHRKLQQPLKPRDLSSLNTVEKFDSVPLILRQRARTYAKDIALVSVLLRGKETHSITWEKLYLKAEKVAQQIGKKSGLYKGDRVTLIYQDFEVIEFAIAFFGTLLAGMVAIPISNELSIKDIIQVMHKTQSHLTLTSDTVYKNFEKLNNDSSNKISWPKGMVFWKTKDMGTFQLSKKHDLPALNLPDLAYIEFSKYPIELKGVVLSHKTIMHQMSNLTRIVSSSPNFGSSTLQRPENVYKVRRDAILCTSDIRCSSGLVMGLLFTIYTGTMLVWTPTDQMDVPGLYANLITKFRTTILLSDLLGLKSVVFNYQADPASTRKFDKKRNVDLSCVKWCIISCLTVNNEVLEIIADRWLKPLGCEKAREAIAPALSLSEYGGMVISVRDWIGKQEKLGAKIVAYIGDDDDDDDDDINEEGDSQSAGKGKDKRKESTAASELSEVLIDKESLSTNTVKVLSDKPPPQSANFDSKIYSKYIRVGAFGFPLLDATIAIVNPETCMLAADMEVGEIWVDSPCLSGGYWDAVEDTNNIFHARCKDYSGHLELEFLRTGLLGFIFNGKVYVLGLYEDRFRQKVTWIDKKEETKQPLLSEIQEEQEEEEQQQQRQQRQQRHQEESVISENTADAANGALKVPVFDNGYRYHYSDHVSNTIFRKVLPVECSTFDIYVNGEYVPVVIIETALAQKRVPSNTIDYISLDALAINTFNILEKVHKVRLFCCAFTTVQALPRALKSGRTEIANMLCKTKFLQGNLRINYVKFNIKHSLSNITTGADITAGIWSPYSSAMRYDMILEPVDRQYTGIDQRTESVDERSHARLSDFKTILDVLKWRVLNQPDSLAFAMINDHKKDLSWKKFDQKVSAICQYILDKTALRPGQYVILMYNLSEDYICALYACFIIGLVPIPMLPLESKRIDEDAKAYFRIVKDFDVHMVFVNAEIEATIFKNKVVSHALKALFVLQRQPILKNTAKVKTVRNISELRSRISVNQAKFDFRNENTTALVTLDWTPDGKRIGIRYTHKVLINLCKILKETFKMSSFNSILGSVRHVSGLGFIQTGLLGVYLGCSTYLFSPLTYYFSPMTFYNALANYKIKDTFLTPAMLTHALSTGKQPKTFQLDKLQNLMVGYAGRPNPEIIANFKSFMSPSRLPGSSINAIYTHRFNPIITSRSYLNLDPVDLWLDPQALRKGFISIVDPQAVPNALHVQDSGVVLCCTQIAIVNPQTLQICKTGEYGEIWVYSEGNALGYTNGIKRSENEFLIAQFNGKLEGFENFKYLRTGDLGFIHTVNQPSIDGTPLEVQLLFVLGNISETFEVLGLHHFASDVERTVESCHPEIYKEASIVFKSDGYTVVVCCAKRKDYLAALAPIIFKSVLNNHQLMVDIVAFMPVTEFEHSRLFEKKRATMLNKWNNSQLPLVNVYGINYGEESVINTVKEMEGIEEISVSTEPSGGEFDSNPISSISSIADSQRSLNEK